MHGGEIIKGPRDSQAISGIATGSIKSALGVLSSAFYNSFVFAR